MGTHPKQTRAHPVEVHRAHERLLADAGLAGYTLTTADGASVHVVERGTGPSVVLIHGSGSPGLFWLPLLRRLDGVRWIVADRPGFGLSDPTPDDQPSVEVAWVESLLDALGLPSAFLVGHSMGALWSMRFALARPERVTGLVMINTPGLPGTRAPLPYRLLATPGVRALIERQRETPRSVQQFARAVGEGETLKTHPDLVELMVAVGNDAVAGRALQHEVRLLLSPWALLSRTGFRRESVLGEQDLARLAVPTLLIWGDRDPMGGADVARGIQALIPGAALEVVSGGHAPWLGKAPEVAEALAGWVSRADGAAPSQLTP